MATTTPPETSSVHPNLPIGGYTPPRQGSETRAQPPMVSWGRGCRQHKFLLSSSLPKKEPKEVICISAPHFMMVAAPDGRGMWSLSLKSYGDGVRLIVSICTETSGTVIKQTAVEWKGMDIRDLPKNAIKIFEELDSKNEDKSIYSTIMNLCPGATRIEQQTEKNKQLRLQKEKEMESSGGGVRDTAIPTKE